VKPSRVEVTGSFAVVTGGSSGIGLAAAKGFAARGARVAIVARNVDKLERAAREIVAQTPKAQVATYSADLSDWDLTNAVFERIVAEHGVPDVLVNSAGVVYPGEFTTMPLEHFHNNFECGFWSMVYPCRAIAPLMVERGRGHIINVASVAGFLGIYGYTGYSAAKYAAIGFSEALRFEMRPHGVGVSCVCPPDTDTPALKFEHTLRPHETNVIAGNIKPISAEKVAAAIVRTVGRDKFMVIPDALSAFYFRLKGLLPEVFHVIVDGDVAKARRSKADA
jgi:3-dehydrosphinganine reductase